VKKINLKRQFFLFSHLCLKMNAEESLSLTPQQIRQIAQKTLENFSDG
jgi:hypothetical protein